MDGLYIIKVNNFFTAIEGILSFISQFMKRAI